MKRILSVSDVAEVLGHSRPWFYARRRRLEQLGFPQKDKELGGWDCAKVTAWLDRRSNLTSQSSVEQIALERIHGASHAGVS